MQKIISKALVLLSILIINTTNIMANNQPQAVTNFKLNNYLGKWYEIARYDHKFERGCNFVTAQYLPTDNPEKIKVINSCTKNNATKQATGKAYFKHNSTIGHLKVSFFWPFYGNYRIIYLAPDYLYAVVDGNPKSPATSKYLWILAKTPTLSPTTMQSIKNTLTAWGYNVNNFIYPQQQ